MEKIHGRKLTCSVRETECAYLHVFRATVLIVSQNLHAWRTTSRLIASSSLIASHTLTGLSMRTLELKSFHNRQKAVSTSEEREGDTHYITGYAGSRDYVGNL